MSKLAFLVMPLWQGSSSSRAMQLIDGANALREDLPVRARYDVTIPLEAGDAMGTPVARLSSVLRGHESARTLLRELDDTDVSVTLGGDCTSVLPGIEAAVHQHGAEHVAVLWFDAHADLQHPSTSPTGAAASMALRHALGDGCEDLRLRTPLRDDALELVGLRSLDGEEEVELARRGISRIDHHGYGPEALAERIRERLAERDATHVYIHVDLDVLDPAEFSAVSSPVPFGMTVAQLTQSIRAARSVLPLAGAAICGFQPQDEHATTENLPTVLRVLGALSAGSGE